MKDMNEKIYIKISNSGVCATLGYVITPINIVRCELSKVYLILQEGFKVEEVDSYGKHISHITLDMFTEKDEEITETVTVEVIEEAIEEKKEDVIESVTTEDETPVEINNHNKKNFKFKK